MRPTIIIAMPATRVTHQGNVTRPAGAAGAATTVCCHLSCLRLFPDSHRGTYRADAPRYLQPTRVLRCARCRIALPRRCHRTPPAVQSARCPAPKWLPPGRLVWLPRVVVRSLRREACSQTIRWAPARPYLPGRHPPSDEIRLVLYFAHARSIQNGRPNLAPYELLRAIFAPSVAQRRGYPMLVRPKTSIKFLMCEIQA